MGWGWLMRRHADAQYAALVARERDTWRLVKSHRVKCVIVRDDGREDPAGFAMFVAEINNLHERRVRMEYAPRLFCETDFEDWATLKEWEMKAEARMPPRFEVEW
jgi:hypothetical protein